MTQWAISQVHPSCRYFEFPVSTSVRVAIQTFNEVTRITDPLGHKTVSRYGCVMWTSYYKPIPWEIKGLMSMILKEGGDVNPAAGIVKSGRGELSYAAARSTNSKTMDEPPQPEQRSSSVHS